MLLLIDSTGIYIYIHSKYIVRNLWSSFTFVYIGPWKGGSKIWIKISNQVDQISKFQLSPYQNFGIPVSKFQKSWIKYQNFKSVDQNFRGLDHGSKFQKRLDHGSKFTPSRALMLVPNNCLSYRFLILIFS